MDELWEWDDNQVISVHVDKRVNHALTGWVSVEQQAAFFSPRQHALHKTGTSICKARDAKPCVSTSVRAISRFTLYPVTRGTLLPWQNKVRGRVYSLALTQSHM